jgi:hypothetical protein
MTMKIYKFDGYKLSLKNTWNMSNGKYQVEYKFKNPDNEIIFSGNDFYSSPLHKPESKKSAIALLGFLTLRLHDIEEDYFKDYTEKQKNFRDSSACEMLQIYICEES